MDVRHSTWRQIRPHDIHFLARAPETGQSAFSKLLPLREALVLNAYAPGITRPVAQADSTIVSHPR